MEINNKTMGPLVFLAGVIVGVNYPKIKKQLQPVMKTLGKKSGNAYVAVSAFFAIQKERVEDLLAKTRIKKAKTEGVIATLGKKRGLKSKVKAEVKERQVEEAIKEGERPSELEMEERVLEFVKSHPDGVKVGDMEDPLGVARMRLGKIAKRLSEEGKIKKEEDMYFSI
ncbi:MAG: hypothetical protein IMZ52_01245 [Actinobacteria bacterium]|nr:hypothetical protein [Actinomycetota bacterium]MBE3127075.1 hypothetical protein [Candidatus Atribacteria bacterium]